MKTTKLIGVMGSGLIGTDPYEENAWSGISRHFFKECDRQGFLHRAFGVELESARRVPLILSNFSFNRDLWRQKFYLDTRYYDLLSKRIVGALKPEDQEHALLQIGGIYNLKPLLNARRQIFSYHDGNLAQAIRSPHFPSRLSKSRVQRALNYEKSVYQNIDMIFTMSDYLRDSFLNDFGIEEQKVRTIGAGINFDSIPPIQEKDYGSKNILFIGADFERKGGMDLLRAFKSVRKIYPSAKLNIIGPRNLGIPSEYSSGVIYHGFLSKREPAQKRKFEQIMHDATIFVMPSLYEPFGIAPLEAMVYEIPCILTNAWAFPEMVTPGINGDLVKCGNVEELAEKIIAFLENPDRLQTMGKAGRELVLRKFTWETVVGNLIKEVSAFSS
jgi:alpha-maltose-1-phosphate synthase